MLNTQAPQQTHRPGPLHQTNKIHKGGRHSKKSSSFDLKSKLIAKPSLKIKRQVRLNQASQARKLRKEQVFEEKRKLGTESHSPLMVGLLDLHTNSCSEFTSSIINYGDKNVLSSRVISDSTMYVTSNRLRMRFKIVSLNAQNFDETLDLVKSLDILLLLHHPNETDYEDNSLYKAIYIHCLPTIIHVIDSLSNVSTRNAKHLLNFKKAVRAKIEEEKLHHVEKIQDLLQLFHLIGNCRRLPSAFKESRTIVVPDKIDHVDNSLAFTGFIRQKLLSPNDLVHIIGYGDYQIKQIDILPDPVPLRTMSELKLRVIQTLLPDPMHQETLEQENDIDPMECEQTWPSNEELAHEAERRNTRRVVKKLPPGTSEYQGAWISEGEEETDNEDSADEENINAILEEDENISIDEEHVDEDACLEEDEIEEIDADYEEDRDDEEARKKYLSEAKLEEMFPDEIDTPTDVPARVRFARYRGLKSLRTSHWDPQENLPPDYSRIYQFQNFQHTKRRVLNERTKEGADPGQYVRIIIADVSNDVKSLIVKRTVPPMIVGLLKYERKMTVMNLLIKRHQDSDLSHPVKSKDELIFHVGFRKFKARPLFTTHCMSSKFKYERFLRDDVAMVATIYAPITFPPAPVLVFRENSKEGLQLIASGTVLDSNPNRLIIKRIRLSGHPFKIHSKSAVVRFMFFNSEDVKYFKPVELTSKYNRRGHITEPLGTHGHMKCTFDRKLRSDDCLFMNLYKRVFPKWTYSPITSVRHLKD